MLRILLRPDLAKILFVGRLLFAFFAPPVVFAHEAHPQTEQARTSDEAAFLAENEAAMNKMMSDMEAKPSGDIDRDFVAMMAPHHQGAIDMAVIELRYGKNETLRRLAQEIIVDQMQEIDAMKLAIGDRVSPSAPAPTQTSASAPMEHHHHMGPPPAAADGKQK